MIEGDIRREKIIEIMSNQKEPVSGSDLAKKFGVSRQVIVQDIALLRATNKNILSTNKGYFLYNPGKGPQKPKRSFCVQHTTEQMQDELYTIVDYGGKVLDAVVEHCHSHGSSGLWMPTVSFVLLVIGLIGKYSGISWFADLGCAERFIFLFNIKN